MTQAAFSPYVVRLPLTVDPAGLKQDLEYAYQQQWEPEAPFTMNSPFGEAPTKVYHDGKWRGLGLKTQGGRSTRTDPGGPGLDDFRETEILSRMPHFQELLRFFQCPTRSIRLLSLPAGAQIQEHRDTYHHFRYGQLRLHMPIVTHEDVGFYVAGERCRWKEGELWYADFSEPHSVVNESPVNRIHLVVDVLLNPFVLSLFPKEFLDAQRPRGFLLHEDPIQLSASALQRYRCRFLLPTALIRGLLEMDDGIEAEFESRIELLDGQLVLFIRDKPITGLVPLSGDRLGMLGWSAERHFQLHFAQDRVHTVELVLRRGEVASRIILPTEP